MFPDFRRTSSVGRPTALWEIVGLSTGTGPIFRSLLKISQKGRYCFCSAVLPPLQDVKIVPLISTLALNTLTLNVRFLKVIGRLFPACDQALRAGMGENFLPRTLVFIPVYATLYIFCMHFGVETLDIKNIISSLK